MVFCFFSLSSVVLHYCQSEGVSGIRLEVRKYEHVGETDIYLDPEQHSKISKN